MMRKFLPYLILFTFLANCSSENSLTQFGNIWVSDPYVAGSELKVEIRNETGYELCYFSDALFYGRRVIENGSGETSVSQPVNGPLSLEEISFHNTGYVASDLRRIGEDSAIISFSLNHGSIEPGDDVSFDIFFCAANNEGLHRTFQYNSRLQ